MECPCIRTSEEGLLSVVLLETTQEITGYAWGVNALLHHMHSFHPWICMSRVPSRSSGLPQRGPGETAKTAVRIIYPRMSYNQAIEVSGLPTLFKRREEISSKLFNEVVGDPGHTLHKLLPPKNPANYSLRRNRDFDLPLCKTDRCKKSFIFSHVFSA